MTPEEVVECRNRMAETNLRLLGYLKSTLRSNESAETKVRWCLGHMENVERQLQRIESEYLTDD